MRANAKKAFSHSRRIFMGILVAGLTACTIDFQLPANQATRITFHQGGKVSTEQEIELREQLTTAVNAWLATNKKNWELGFVTRPRGLYFEGANFYVNVLKNEVSVKYCKAHYHCQLYIKKDDHLYYQLQDILKPRRTP